MYANPIHDRKAMTEHNDNLTPQQRLAQIVAEETDGGRLIVRFFKQVVQGERDSEGFQPNHKMDSAKQLVKIGLTEFQDYIDANHSPPKPRGTRRQSPDDPDISPEIQEAREEQSTLRQLLPQDILDIVDSDDPLDDCPCVIAESEGRDIPCPENEECPYYGIEFPKFTEEQSVRIGEEALRGLRMRSEMLWGAPNPSKEDP